MTAMKVSHWRDAGTSNSKGLLLPSISWELIITLPYHSLMYAWQPLRRECHLLSYVRHCTSGGEPGPGRLSRWDSPPTPQYCFSGNWISFWGVQGVRIPQRHKPDCVRSQVPPSTLFDKLTTGNTSLRSESWILLCLHLQDTSTEFLPLMLRGRGECRAEARNFRSALVLAISSQYTSVFQKRRVKREEGLFLSHMNRVKRFSKDLRSKQPAWGVLLSTLIIHSSNHWYF